MTKRELDGAAATSLAQALEVEALAESVNVHTDDLREALTAYMERRPPSSRAGSERSTSATIESWEDVLEDLSTPRRVTGDGRRRAAAKHREPGKLDARARIEDLLDRGSFQELGTLVGGEEAPADAIVMGSGRIDGRPVMVAAEDFTVKAGTISQAADRRGACARGRRTTSASWVRSGTSPLVLARACSRRHGLGSAVRQRTFSARRSSTSLKRISDPRNTRATEVAEMLSPCGRTASGASDERIRASSLPGTGSVRRAGGQPTGARTALKSCQSLSSRLRGALATGDATAVNRRSCGKTAQRTRSI